MPCRPLSPLDNILANWHPLLPDPPALPPAFFDLRVPPSPSDSASSASSASSLADPPSPTCDPIRVVCNVPLLAPRPLPYHSPTFLQFDLPDTDEDLSHPPYTHRPPKRKHDAEGDPAPQPKRRPGTHRWKPRLPHRARDHPASSHRPSNPRSCS